MDLVEVVTQLHPQYLSGILLQSVMGQLTHLYLNHNTDNYVAKIPNFDSTKYKRGNSGDHWYYLSEAYATRQLYDWFKSLITTVPVTYTPGQLELGSDGNVYGNFNGNRIQLSLPK